MTRKFSRRSAIKSIGTAATGISITTALTGTASAFSDGEQVEATTALNTREQPGTDQPIVATVNDGEVGEIMNGPTEKGGYTWWGVHWLDRNVWGWSVEQYLTSTSGGGGGSKPSVSFDQAASGNYSSANRTASDIRWIIIHTIEGSYEGGISVFNDPNSGVSAHYVIGNSTGQRTQMVRDDDIAYTAGNWDYNTAGINIENEGYAAESHPDQLYQNLASIVSWACEEYGIPKSHPTGVAPADPADGAGIIGHAQVPDPNNPSVGGGANHHHDPGDGWEWDYFMSLL
ncbi:N-acetylmuramoyl-L-alanine amidase [Haladaptatus sp. CMAA 1911]|uniref:N-acetylmuramoyl-L-alanine amidase n=1 Tax=unclassified Haladaptatus TaxID=2622732 RepID=UPI003754F9AC